MSTKPGSEAPSEELVPALQEIVQATGLDAARLALAFETDDHGQVRLIDKFTLMISDGEKAAPWKVDSLTGLLRGNRKPPADIDHYPPAYVPCFAFIEKHVLTLCTAMGDRPDQELEGIYSMLRRRPDGRSLGVAHDFLWQTSALLLGRFVLSEAEFAGVIGALERSTRGWGLKPISRNYVAYLRKAFGR